MKKIALAGALALALTSCQSIDTKIGDLTDKVQKYCTTLETASSLADVIANKPLTAKIDRAVNTYCNSPITDLPSAIIALANIMKAVNAAGINP